MTTDDLRRAHATGTGCFSSLPGDRDLVRFAMVDDHAAAKVGGRVVAFAPAPDARDLFPFTHDAWTGGGLSIRVRRVGSDRRFGSEGLVASTVLVVTSGKRSRTVRGGMICGS